MFDLSEQGEEDSQGALLPVGQTKAMLLQVEYVCGYEGVSLTLPVL
jgi:hypothetical protein